MKNLNWQTTGELLAILTTACTICVLALRTIFDDRYYIKNKDPEYRHIIKKEFDDYHKLMESYFKSIEIKLTHLKERILKNGNDN